MPMRALTLPPAGGTPSPNLGEGVRCGRERLPDGLSLPALTHHPAVPRAPAHPRGGAYPHELFRFCVEATTPETSHYRIPLVRVLSLLESATSVAV